MCHLPACLLRMQKNKKLSHTQHTGVQVYPSNVNCVTYPSAYTAHRTFRGSSRMERETSCFICTSHRRLFSFPSIALLPFPLSCVRVVSPAAHSQNVVSRASRIFPMCTHARMTSGRGESARKNTSGHSRQVFVSQPGMLG